MAGLSGVRVVDLGRGIAGPLAALLLAEAGADVVHVDAPGTVPDATDAWLNRSKRRITLDLAAPGDRATARELIARADVVVENYGPGVAERLGIGAAELAAAHPTLVHCALPGFGPGEPVGAVAAWEGIVHAAVAGYRPLSQHWDPSGRKRCTVEDPDAPLFTPITTASNFGGLLGAVGVVMALIARQRTGRGQRVHIPLSEAFAEAYSTMLGMRVYENPLMGDGQMLRELTYLTADGGRIDLSPYAKFVIRLLDAAGVAGEWEAAGLIDVAASSFDLARRPEIIDRFTALVAAHPTEWWDELATRAEVPASRVRTPAEWAATAHARESGAVVELDGLVLPGRGFDLDDVVPLPFARHLPDADRAEVLASLTAAPVAVPAGDEDLVLPLEGITGVDISQAVAGPTAARLLADFGAEIVKIGSTRPATTDGIVGHLHRGKRTMLVNPRSTEGTELVQDLVVGSDFLVTNLNWRSQERYGIDAPRLRARNPRLVHCAVTAYGRTGPFAYRRGYENQCNAATGMSSRYGSRFGWTLYQPTPINDAATGILGAYATAVALFARAVSGEGQAVGTSLVQASTIHQGVHVAAEAAGESADDRRTEYGTSALNRLYRASDRWFFLAARPAQLGELLTTTRVSSAAPADDPAGELAQLLAARFAEAPAAEWVAGLGSLGIAAQVVATIDEAVAHLAEIGIVYTEPGPTGDPVARPGVGRWLSETPPRVGANPGAVGSQLIEILTEHGLADAEITRLADEGIVRLPGGPPLITQLT